MSSGGRLNEASFRFGIRDLDRQYSCVISPGTIILIAGHPGAGKTTFAAMMCHVNALEGKPCLYISFNEEKDKFMNWMRGLGFDFTELERRSLFKFVKLPILTEDTLFSSLMDIIVENVSKFKPSVLVIDSITPVGEVLGKEGARVRSFLQNFLTNLSRSMGGIIVLVAEIPLSTEYVSLGSAEFVADMVIIMKHRIEGSRLVRVMELRKVRGAPINVAEIPFAIREGEGIRVFTPPIMRRSTGPDLSRYYEFRCRALRDALGHVHPGASIVYIIPSRARTPDVTLASILELIVRYGLRTALISYRLTSAEIRHYFTESLERIGLPKIVNEAWRNVVFAEGVNPTAHSLEEVLHKVLDALDRKPDIVILHGVENLFMVYGDIQKTYNSLFNIVQHHKTLGVVTVLISTKIREDLSDILSNLADAVIEVNYDFSGRPGELHPHTYLWAAGRPPRTLSYDELRECLEEIQEGVRRG